MSKQIIVKLNRDARELVARFKVAAEKNGIHMAGDHQRGKFIGMGIEGRYEIEGDMLAIHILKKPMLISWSIIEAKVREFFS